MRRFLPALLALALVAGCHRPARPPEAGEPLADAAAAVAVVARRDVDTRTMTATFKLVVRTADGATESSRGAVVVARPDRFRLQIFSFGVVTAYDYTVNGEHFRERRPLEGIDKLGHFDEDETSGEKLGGEDLRPLFLGIAGIDAATARDAGERYVVVTDAQGVRREVEVSKRDARITRETLLTGGVPRVVIDYDDYRPVDGVALPHKIAVAYPKRSLALTIEVTQYTRNQPVDPALFTF